MFMTLNQFRAPLSRRDYIDGYCIPRGKTTLLAVPGASGKTTAALTAAISASTSGLFHFFGSRQHDRPLRCMIISGEESLDDFRLKLDEEHHDTRAGVIDALEADRLRIISLADLRSEGSITSVKIFDEYGSPDINREENERKPWPILARMIAEWRPDFIFIDTLGAVSMSEYLDGNSPYNTLGVLDDLATRCNAAIVVAVHLTKEGSGKLEINEKTAPSSLLSMMRGSGQMASAARSVIVMAEATGLAFKGDDERDSDRRYAMVIKSNLGHRDTMKILPVIRSSELRTFVATTAEGVTLASVAASDRRLRIESLLDVLPRLVYAASLAGSPFAQTGKMSIGALIDTVLSDALPSGVTPEEIDTTLERLVRNEKVVMVRESRAGGMTYDLPSGPFARQSETGKKTEFRKGAARKDYLTEAAIATRMSDVERIYREMYVRAGVAEERPEDEREVAHPGPVADDVAMDQIYAELENGEIEDGLGDDLDLDDMLNDSDAVEIPVAETEAASEPDPEPEAAPEPEVAAEKEEVKVEKVDQLDACPF